MSDHPAEGKRLADLLSHADSIVGHGDNTAYISRASSKYVRDVVRELAAALRSQGGKALADAIAVIRAESCPFREGPMADGWAEAWATFLNRLGDEDGLNNLYANSTAHSPSGKASMTSANLAALIHEARFPEGKDAPNYIPFLHEDRSGREYCLRIARKIIETVELAAAAPSPAGSVTTWQPIKTAPKDGTPIEAVNSRHADIHPPVIVRWRADEDPHWCDAATVAGDALYYNAELYYNADYFDYWKPVSVFSREGQS